MTHNTGTLYVNSVSIVKYVIQ